MEHLTQYDNAAWEQALEEFRARVTPRDETPVEELTGHDFLKICDRACILKTEMNAAQ